MYADNYSGNIDDPIEDGDTLLHIACLYGHLPCVQVNVVILNYFCSAISCILTVVILSATVGTSS